MDSLFWGIKLSDLLSILGAIVAFISLLVSGYSLWHNRRPRVTTVWSIAMQEQDPHPSRYILSNDGIHDAHSVQIEYVFRDYQWGIQVIGDVKALAKSKVQLHGDDHEIAMLIKYRDIAGFPHITPIDTYGIVDLSKKSNLLSKCDRFIRTIKLKRLMKLRTNQWKWNRVRRKQMNTEKLKRQ